MWTIKFTLILAVALLLVFPSTSFSNNPDPYKILGIRPTATEEEIRNAYRRKAKEVHPDKNPNNPQAADQFRRVAEAFELLSDPHSRKKYDAKLKNEKRRRQQARDQQRRQEEMQRRKHAREKEERLRKQREMVDKAKMSYGRILRVSSLEEFERVFVQGVGEAKVYRLNILMMFVSNKNAERRAEEEYYFPYPFAGEFEDYNSYESILKVAKVRFNSQTPLTQVFRARSGSFPHIIFARKGDPLWKFETYQARKHVDTHEDFKRWVQSHLLATTTLVNAHSLPVDIFVMRDDRAVFIHNALHSNHEITLNLRSGDRIIAFDSRVDNFPGSLRNNNHIPDAEGVLLMDDIVVGDAVLRINYKRCVDLSTKCPVWLLSGKKQRDSCSNHPEFMHHMCPFSCGVCSESATSNLSYFLFHYPEHKLPSMLRGSVAFMRFFVEDIQNILTLRKNAAAAFFVVGLLIACNFLLWKAISKWSPKPGHPYLESEFMLVMDILLFLIAAMLCVGMVWMAYTPTRGVPSWLKLFHKDFVRVIKEFDVFVTLIIVGLITSTSFLTLILKDSMEGEDLLVFAAIMSFLVAGMLGMISYTTASGRAHHLKHIWQYRKNAAFAICGAGAYCGVGLMSLKRLTKPLPMKLIVSLIIPNIAILCGIWFLASIDRHFYADLMHVLKLRKNAATAFVLLGVFMGQLFIKVHERWNDDSQSKTKVKIEREYNESQPAYKEKIL